MSGHRKTCAMAALKQANLEDKGSLAKLGEAIRTKNGNRYYEICLPLRR